MIWLAGILAIALMLAILELDPNQLYAISSVPFYVGSERWQASAYLMLLIIGLIVSIRWCVKREFRWLVPYLITHLPNLFCYTFLNPLLKLFQKTNQTHPDSLSPHSKQSPLENTCTTELKLTDSRPITSNKQASNKQDSNKQASNKQASNKQASNKQASNKQAPRPTDLYLTPWQDLRNQGVIKLVVKLTLLLLILLAVLLNGVAQRMAFIESSPPQTVYVEAIVSPMGLSDKPLILENGEVLQGYRQLVKLSDIKLASIHETFTTNEGVTDSNSLLLNPFMALENTEADQMQSPAAAITLPESMTVMLQSYQVKDMALNGFASDQQLTMKLVVKPLELKDRDNPDEFDEYRWLSSRHATAKAYIVTADYEAVEQIERLTLPQKIDVMRFKFREHFIQLMQARSQDSSLKQLDLIDSKSFTVPLDADILFGSDSNQENDDEVEKTKAVENNKKANNQDGVAITLSLLTGDRSLISDDMTALYRFGGISHLLAISGTHVLFLSLLCATLLTGLINRIKPSLYNILPRWQCAFIITVITAFGYALFAGFDVPAVRTACMLLLVGVMRYFLAVPAIFKMLLILAVAMAWLDIFVLWQAGFWLSFIAVAVLVLYSRRIEQDSNSELTTSAKLKQQLFTLFKLQLWMSVALLPISLWLFGKVSLWGFIVNLFAIGLFGWVIVPLNLLASVIYVIMPDNALPNYIWSLLFWVLDRLHGVLLALQSLFQQSGWLYVQMNLTLLVLLFLMALPWLLPKAMLNRLYSLVPLMAIVMLVNISPAVNDTAENPVNIQVLNPKNSLYAASLIHNEQQAWLLMSSYEKKYQSEQSSLTPQQQKKLSQTLYDQLKNHDVSQLTGVIVQTETASLAPVIAQLSRYMPISYYWQAGLREHKPTVDIALSGLSLQAQSCHSGKQWSMQEGKQNQSNGIMLTALTGWEQVEDSRVWDCAIEVSTTQPIYLNEQGKMVLFLADMDVNKGAKDSDLDREVINYKASNSAPNFDVENLTELDDMDIKSIAKHNNNNKSNKNKVLMYSSSELQLGQLWPLMCAKELRERGTITQIQAQTQNNSPQYWITPSQALIDKNMIDSFAPTQWKITGLNSVPAKSQLKESHLYWRQTGLNITVK